MRSSLAVAAGLGFALSASIAGAQTSPPDFSGLRVKVGDIIYVTDRETGLAVSGRLKALSPSEVAIDGYVFQPHPGLQIQREGDAIWEGALAGLGAGLLLGSTVGPDTCASRSSALCAVAAGLELAAIGACIDWRHKGRTTIYKAARTRGRTSIQLLPQISTRQQGVGLIVSF